MCPLTLLVSPRRAYAWRNAPATVSRFQIPGYVSPDLFRGSMILRHKKDRTTRERSKISIECRSRFHLLQIACTLYNAVAAFSIRKIPSRSDFAVFVTVKHRYTHSLTCSISRPSSSTSSCSTYCHCFGVSKVDRHTVLPTVFIETVCIFICLIFTSCHWVDILHITTRNNYSSATVTGGRDR